MSIDEDPAIAVFNTFRNENRHNNNIRTIPTYRWRHGIAQWYNTMNDKKIKMKIQTLKLQNAFIKNVPYIHTCYQVCIKLGIL